MQEYDIWKRNSELFPTVETYTNAHICQGYFYFFYATCFAAMETWPIVVDMNKQKYELRITLFISNLCNSW